MRTIRHTGTIKKIYPLGEMGRVSIVKFLLSEPGFTDPASPVWSRPQVHKIQAMNDAIKFLDGISEGDEVTITCWINSKEVYRDGVVDYWPCIRLKELQKIKA